MCSPALHRQSDSPLKLPRSSEGPLGTVWTSWPRVARARPGRHSTKHLLPGSPSCLLPQEAFRLAVPTLGLIPIPAFPSRAGTSGHSERTECEDSHRPASLSTEADSSQMAQSFIAHHSASLEPRAVSKLCSARDLFLTAPVSRENDNHVSVQPARLQSIPSL